MTTPALNAISARDGVIELNGQFFLQQQDRAQSEFQHRKGEMALSAQAIRRAGRRTRAARPAT